MILDAFDNFEPLTGTAVTAGGPSTNVLDTLNPRDMGVGANDIRLIVYCVAAFVGLTSLNIQLQVSPDNATWTTAEETGPIPIASLLLNKKLWDTTLPHRPPSPTVNFPRYYRLNYVVVGGPATAGALFAGLAINTEATPAYPAGVVIYN